MRAGDALSSGQPRLPFSEPAPLPGTMRGSAMDRKLRPATESIREHGAAVRRRVRRALFLSCMVEERASFLAREALPRRATCRYRVRGEGIRVSMRHHDQGLAAGSADAWVLYEVFRSVDYRFPEGVVAALAQRGDQLRIADVGANVGFFSLRALSRYPDGTVTAFEPDGANAALLRSNLQHNGLENRANVIEACAYTKDGSLTFVGGQGGMSHVAFDGGEGRVLPAVDAFSYLEGADLIKLDIEGGEWELLADERFPRLPAAAIVLEYHSLACPGENARQEASSRLRESGYEIYHPQPGRFPASGPVWGASVLWAYRGGRARRG